MKSKDNARAKKRARMHPQKVIIASNRGGSKKMLWIPEHIGVVDSPELSEIDRDFEKHGELK